MLNLTGSYECKMDAKGRLKLPTALTRQLAPELQEGFVVKRALFDKCLELYPMSQWNLLMKRINKLNRFNKKNNDFIRKFSAGVKMVEIDTAGRLLVPRELVTFAHLDKEITLSAVGEIVEIWDRARYEETISMDEEDFGALAQEVMGETLEIPDELS